MDLILWRHADAEEGAPGAPDEARRLTPKGRSQAKEVAAWLKKQLPDDARVLASPARRAQETAQALTRRFKVSRQLGTAAEPASLLKAAGWPAGRGTVVIVGHQPTLGQAAALALTGHPAEWSVKKGAIWWLESRGENGVVVRAVIEPDTA
jgi:phosphohistidine phosphatase